MKPSDPPVLLLGVPYSWALFNLSLIMMLVVSTGTGWWAALGLLVHVGCMGIARRQWREQRKE